MLDKIWENTKRAVKGETSLIASAVGEELNKRIEQAEQSVEAATLKAIKTSVVYILIFIGIIFFLIGASQYVEAAFQLTRGTGYAIVGVIVILLGRFAAFFR